MVDNKTYLDAGKTSNFESIRLSKTKVNDAEQLQDFLDDEINEHKDRENTINYNNS